MKPKWETMKEEDALGYAEWMCNYWARGLFERNENSVAGWFYLFLAEQIRDEMTGGQNV